MSKADIMAGRAYVSLYVKQTDFAKGLDAAKKDLTDLGNSMLSLGTKVTAMGAGVVGGLTAAVFKASEFEETFSKFSVVFGANTSAVKQWSDNFAANVGRSETQVVNFLASTQDLLVPMGYAADAATDMSKQITGLAVDLASFNNKADADVLRDLHAALTGSGEVMKKYGVIVSEAATKQELLRMGLNPAVVTEAEKAQARFNLILAGTTAAQGDAVRTSGSFANQMKAVRASIDNVVTEIGTALLPAYAEILGYVNKVVVRITKFVSVNKQVVVSIAKVGAILLVAGSAILAIGGSFIGLGMVFGAISTAMAGFVSAIGAIMSVATVAVTAIAAMLSPLGLLVAALIGGGYAWVRFTESGRSAVSGLLGMITETFGGIYTVVTDTIGGIVTAIQSGDLELAGQIAMVGLRLAFSQGMEAVHGLFGETLGTMAGQLIGGDFAGAWSTLGGLILNSFATVTQGLVSMFTGAANAIINKWAETINKISDFILESAAEGGAMGWALEQVSGVNMKEEAARGKRIEAERRKKGMTPDNGGIMDSSQYQDPAVKAMQERVQALTADLDARVASITAATGASLAEQTSGQTAAVSENVKLLQDELAALRGQAAKKMADIKSGEAEKMASAEGKTGEQKSSGGSGKIGKASSASFSLASLSQMAGRSTMESKQLSATEKAAKAGEKQVEKLGDLVAEVKGWSLHHA